MGELHLSHGFLCNSIAPGKIIQDIAKTAKHAQKPAKHEIDMLVVILRS